MSFGSTNKFYLIINQNNLEPETDHRSRLNKSTQYGTTATDRCQAPESVFSLMLCYVMLCYFNFRLTWKLVKKIHLMLLLWINFVNCSSKQSDDCPWSFCILTIGKCVIASISEKLTMDGSEAAWHAGTAAAVSNTDGEVVNEKTPLLTRARSTDSTSRFVHLCESVQNMRG